MPLDIYPPATVSTTRNWVQLGTATGNSSAATYTFSSLAAYSFYRIIMNQVTHNTTQDCVRFNNDAGSNYVYSYLTTAASGTTAGIPPQGQLRLPTTSASSYTADLIIESASIYPRILGYAVNSGSDVATNISGTYLSATQINRIDVYTNNGSNYTGGTIIIYGSN